MTSTTAILQTDRFILRRPRAADWPQAHDFFTSERSAMVGGPNAPDQAWRIFAMELGHWDLRGFGMWTVTRRDDDVAQALIGPWYPHGWPEKEIGWMVWNPDAEGTGMAAEAATAAIADAYDRLGWDTVVHYIAPENARSIALAERVGARLDDSAPQIPGKPPHLVYRSPRPEPRP